MKSLRFAAAAFVVGFGFASSAVAITSASFPFDPKHFNVFAGGNIGSAQQPYGSDYQGIAGVTGDFYASGFSLHDIAASGPGTGVSLYAGGNVMIAGSINNGGVQAGGNVTVHNASIFGNVNAGGDLNGPGGTVHGNATLGGTKTTGNPLTVTGSVTPNTPFTPTIDLNLVANYFQEVSDGFSAMATSVASSETLWGGEMNVTLNSGLNILNLTAAQFNPLWELDVTGGPDSFLVVNILDSGTISLDALTFILNGIGQDDILINIANASALNFSGGQWVSILAIDSMVHFSSGVLAGNLITGNLTGGGQVNDGFFSHFDSALPPSPPTGLVPPTAPNLEDVAIPEPTGFLLLSVAAAAIWLNVRRARGRVVA